MILGENPGITRTLQTDLKVLGIKTSLGRYLDINMNTINRILPNIALLELTSGDRNTQAIYEVLLGEDALPTETAPVALVSENTIGRIPLDFRFADIIMYPYDITELAFRLRRVVHLYHPEPEQDEIHIGNLSISLSTYEVKVGGRTADLSFKEYELFKYLVTRPDRVFTRKALLADIWGYGQVSDSRTVDVHIRRVRVKIGASDRTHIKTVRGAGYALRSEAA
jgi:DNA-binding response OmpR family regulator